MGKKTKAVVKGPDKAVHCSAGATDAEKWRNSAALICGPELAAFRVIHAADGQGSIGEMLDVPALMEHLRDQAGAVQGGNLSQAEAMLMNQAIALQSLFARLVERGISAEMLQRMESFMKLALRAQNQCRATLETLATIKNPPVVFAKQANITNGPQQVNNGIGIEAPRAREDKKEQNQILEAIPNERLDFGAETTTSGVNQAMETVGAYDRATNRGGKTGKRQARI